MTADELVDQLDEDTVLKVTGFGHTDQYVYRFPSGIMVTVWGDRDATDSTIAVMDEDHVSDVLSSEEGNDPIELVPFEESPYADE